MYNDNQVIKKRKIVIKSNTFYKVLQSHAVIIQNNRIEKNMILSTV